MPHAMAVRQPETRSVSFDEIESIRAIPRAPPGKYYQYHQNMIAIFSSNKFFMLIIIGLLPRGDMRLKVTAQISTDQISSLL